MMNYDYLLLSLKTIMMGTIYTLCNPINYLGRKE